MSKIYLYPKTEIRRSDSNNPYIGNLEESISRYCSIVNTDNSKWGVLDLFKYLPAADAYLFNWIEDLPSRKLGKLQTAFFMLFLIFSKIFRKKIIWVLHNKYSHNVHKNKLTDFLFNLMAKKSDLILTHSQSGVNFLTDTYKISESRIKYINHPILDMLPQLSSVPKTFDFLIWGIIYRYKGIVEFLQFLKDSNQNHFKILIVGRCIDEELKNDLNKYLSENIVHYDKFYQLEEIAEFANKSKFILFTYKSTSVLSSAALVDSIRMSAIIIGPNIGAFKDLNNYSFIKTYNKYADIFKIYDDYKPLKDLETTDVNAFYRDNCWDRFGQKFSMNLGDLGI